MPCLIALLDCLSLAGGDSRGTSTETPGCVSGQRLCQLGPPMSVEFVRLPSCLCRNP